MNTSALALTDTERRIAERIDTTAASALSVSDAAGGLSFVSMAQIMEFAKMMSVGGIAIPKHLRGNPGACMAVTLQAVEWRMSPYAVANKSYSVNDRLAYESQLVQAVILQRAPIKGRFRVKYEGVADKRICTVIAVLDDGSDEVVDYASPEFGKINPKNSPLWVNDPDQQLFYYSARALCRRHFPDVLLGVYAKDEIEDAPRDVAAPRQTQPKALNDRLDALALRTGDTADEKLADAFVEVATDAQQDDGDAPASEDPSTSEPEIDPTCDDFKLGYEGGIQGLRKGFTAAIKSDPARLANYEAGQVAGREQAAKDD